MPSLRRISRTNPRSLADTNLFRKALLRGLESGSGSASSSLPCSFSFGDGKAFAGGEASAAPVSVANGGAPQMTNLGGVAVTATVSGKELEADEAALS